MVKPSNFDMIAEGLDVPERVLLFCIASATDWQKAGVTHMTAGRLFIRGLIDRERALRNVETRIARQSGRCSICEGISSETVPAPIVL